MLNRRYEWQRRNVEFATADGTVLRGWHYAQGVRGRPVIVMSHGTGATKEMGLDLTAADFASAGYNCLVYDHRNLGESDGVIRQHIDPWQQIADARDAITFSRNMDGVDGSRLAIWGTSLSGGHALVLGATDRRIRAVITQACTISGWRNAQRRQPGDMWKVMSERFADDRDAALQGAPLTLTTQNSDVTADDVNHVPAPDEVFVIGNSFKQWARSMPPAALSSWPNQLTLRTYENYRSYEPGVFVSRIAPTPLLVICALDDSVTPTDEILSAYNEAREPKQLVMRPGGHYDLYVGQRAQASAAAISFLGEVL